MNITQCFKSCRSLLILLFFLAIIFIAYYFYPNSAALTAQQADELELSQLTWVEVRSLIQQGKTSIIIPTAGIEQNGPHMILGKHGHIVRHTALAIAQELGNTLVASTIETVPQGAIDPPTGHMNFPGTISIPETVYELILEHTARSFVSHGFKTIMFIGDSGGNQTGQERVAEKLNEEWQSFNTRVLHISNYYSLNGQADWLRANGYTDRQIGTHAGIRDTSELLFVLPKGVRNHYLSLDRNYYREPTGSNGEPALASREIGAIMLQLKVESAVQQIRMLMTTD
jgi:creatinine amidohydrolase/Fe(II)-dependent formamide hydrolase-like protein